MSALRQKIMDGVKIAMREKDSIRLETLRFLQSAIKYREIEARPTELTEDDVLVVIKKLIKQRKESIEQYQAAARADLVDKESAELKILETFLPQQMSREVVEALVVEVIGSLGAKSQKDMGGVMKEVIARSQGAADNKLISELVRAKLTL